MISFFLSREKNNYDKAMRCLKGGIEIIIIIKAEADVSLRPWKKKRLLIPLRDGG